MAGLSTKCCRADPKRLTNNPGSGAVTKAPPTRIFSPPLQARWGGTISVSSRRIGRGGNVINMSSQNLRAVIVRVCLGRLGHWLAPAQPVITTQPQDQFPALGSVATLSASITRFGPFSYQWLFEGMTLTGSHQPLCERVMKGSVPHNHILR